MIILFVLKAATILASVLLFSAMVIHFLLIYKKNIRFKMMLYISVVLSFLVPVGLYNLFF